ncbi:preprotein translocase subunit YajC [Streptococcus sp. 121]|uniref:preprotein translocase subunit YajC n=1 Tax=Streptococcus sp. 121 TaxID=2797637 RepID=UPI0018F0D06A|nr:preprotein translocase subunit YajC [Streptococcus sp. 121]MBJ6746212.1 preprotein translocase subunit YajC [Streptococcus sp. 121]
MNLQFVWMLLIFGGMLFFMQRQQKKQQAKRQEQMASLAKGTEIVTIGGLYGVIDEIDREANKMVLDVDGVYLTFELTALKAVVNAPKVEETAVEVVEEEVLEDPIETSDK